MKDKNYKTEFNKRIYKYALDIIRFVEKLPKETTSQVLAKQLIRSGTSVSANIIEAQSASSKKDYINFYTIALKSANESKLWISLLRDTGKTNKEEAAKLLTETIEIAKILGASVITMKNKNKI
ncbi:TPA: four helix bundle protein [Candidatus Woesearchaeota archaeon]|nr:four helix bundle protein [Candidatus Woesearchaeota archaeon]